MKQTNLLVVKHEQCENAIVGNLRGRKLSRILRFVIVLSTKVWACRTHLYGGSPFRECFLPEILTSY